MNSIEIIEKPKYISWDIIHDVLYAAHASNRSSGIIMKLPSLPGDEIAKRIDKGNGKMLVALDGKKVIGVAGYQIKKGHNWFCQSEYLYLCFAGVRPEYIGQGVYKQLYIYIERERERLGLPLMLFDTHEDNKKMIEINRKNGFEKIGYKDCGDHLNIIMAKWYVECPFSNNFIAFRFYLSKMKNKIRKSLNRIKQYL